MKKKHLILAIPFLVGFLIGYSSHFRSPGETVVERVDTLTVHDTITREKPVFVDRYLLRTDTVKLAVHDTTLRVDSVLVDVPIETRVYAEDSVYRAVVSGWKPSLDTLLVYNTTREVTKFVPIRDLRRWGVGLTAGYGVGKGGLTPYVGVGITYNLVNF